MKFNHKRPDPGIIKILLILVEKNKTKKSQSNKNHLLKSLLIDKGSIHTLCLIICVYCCLIYLTIISVVCSKDLEKSHPMHACRDFTITESREITDPIRKRIVAEMREQARLRRKNYQPHIDLMAQADIMKSFEENF